MKTLKLAVIAAFLTLSVNMAQAQVHIGVSFGYPARPVYYRPAPVYYRPAPVYYAPAPVYYAPAPVVVRSGYPVYYRRHHYSYYRRPVVYRRVYRRW